MNHSGKEKKRNRLDNPFFRRAVVLLLLLSHFLLAFFSARMKAATIDEPYHIGPGVSALFSGDFRMSVDTPPLINLICALPLVFVSDLQVPFQDPVWHNPKADPADRKWRFADFLLWKRDYGPWKGNPDPLRLIMLARIPVMMLSVILGLLVYLSASRFFGNRGGLAALALYSFSPTILAHARLATADLGCALTVFLAVYVFYLFLLRPSAARALLAGLCLGLALLAKHTGVFLLLIFPLSILALRFKEKRLKKAGAECADLLPRGRFGVWGWLLFIYSVSLLAVWAGHGFEVHSIHDPCSLRAIKLEGDPWAGLRKAIVEAICLLPLPPRTYYFGLARSLLNRAGKYLPVYFMGKVMDKGPWYYYPALFAIKVPSSLLALFGLWWWKRKSFPRMDPKASALMAGTGFGILAIFTIFNLRTIGIRHLLPLFPLLHVSISRVFSENADPGKRTRALAAFLFFAYCINGVVSFPDYLTHFNWLVGGTDRGLRISVVGEDWGQDLAGLGRFVKEKGIREIHYNPYSWADPGVYGVPYKRFRCGGPHEPGWYALHMVQLLRPPRKEPNCYRNFNELEPQAVIHHTILVYHVSDDEVETRAEK